MTRRNFLAAAAATGTALAAPAKPKNVVLIYCDDLGYGDLGCYGSAIPTPHIDSLARDGMRFTHFYSANPVCSPSRAALMTGRYPTRVQVPRVLFPNAPDGLPDSETTIAKMLKPSGYRTACVGKWHLGDKPEYLPAARGFDSYFGIPYSNDMTPRLLVEQRNGQTEIIEQKATLETLTPRYTQKAVEFIDSSKAAPFFLYMPHTYPHIPLAASPKFRGKSPYGMYGDVLSELDWSVGEVLGALKRNGLEQDTLVLFSSDNGPWFQGSPGKLRGRKGSTLDGGVRVPLLARLPGRIPKGKVCDGVASTMDILPTVAGLTGAALPSGPLDGINIWPMLEGKKPAIDREALLYFDGWNLQCARQGKWKLHVSRYNSHNYGPQPATGRVNLPLAKPELYDMTMDLDESYDVAPENPQVVADLQARIEKLVPGFPAEVRKAWDETRARPTGVPEPGRLPAPPKPAA